MAQRIFAVVADNDPMDSDEREWRTLCWYETEEEALSYAAHLTAIAAMCDHAFPGYGDRARMTEDALKASLEALATWRLEAVTQLHSAGDTDFSGNLDMCNLTYSAVPIMRGSWHA